MVGSVFEIVESWVEEDEPELLHAENRKAILAKKINGFMVLSFTILSSEKLFRRQNYFSQLQSQRINQIRKILILLFCIFSHVFKK
jgi:hypothetical protein